MLARLKITTRINLTLLLAVLGIVMVAVIGFSIMRAQMMDERRGQLRNLLDLTLSIARADMMAAGGPTSEAGKKAFFSVLRSTRFGDEKQANYIFAFDYDGVATAMNDPSKLGNNLTGIADANGVKFVKEFINIARGPSGTGFIEYLYQKGVGGPITSKISLVQNIPEIGGLAGVGVYLDDLDQTFFHRLFMELWHSKKVLLIGLFITAGLHRTTQLLAYLRDRNGPRGSQFSGRCRGCRRLLKGNRSYPAGRDRGPLRDPQSYDGQSARHRQGRRRHRQRRSHRGGQAVVGQGHARASRFKRMTGEASHRRQRCA